MQVIDAVLATALLALGCLLAYYRLGVEPLAADEATSYFIGHLDWPRLWISLKTSEANASLFYVTLHHWITVGEAEAVLRSLPAAFGAATVPVLYVLVARLFGRLQGIVAATLLTVNAFYIAHAQELRGYSMSAFLVTTSTLFFVQFVRTRTRASWIGYVAVSALGMYAHFFVALVLVAHVLSLAFSPRRDVPAGGLAAAYALVAALIAPLGYFVLFNDVGQVDWIPPPNLAVLRSALVGLTGGGDVLLYLYGVFLLLALVFLVRHLVGGGRSHLTWATALVVLWAGLPVGIAFGISYVKPLFIARYLLVAVPGVASVAAVGLSMLENRWLVAVPALAVVALSAAQLVELYAPEPILGWDVRARYVAEHSTPEDAIVFYSPTVIRPFGYYSGYYSKEAAVGRVPPPLYPSLYWLGYSATRFSPRYAHIRARVSNHDRAWLVAGYARDPPRHAEKRRMIEALKDTCDKVLDRKKFVRGGLILFSSCRG
jgi:mannosyltransferase